VTVDAETDEAFQVLGSSQVESRFDALRGSALTPLVGRDEELDLIQRRWAEAKQGQGRVIVVTGEPGIGKSRLMRAAQERLGAELHDPLIYHCSPHHQDSALYPVISQLLRAAGTREVAPGFGSDRPGVKRGPTDHLRDHSMSVGGSDVGDAVVLVLFGDGPCGARPIR
jgi:AAA ATPase-like protein